MADFAKVTAKCLYSKNSDFSSPKVEFNPAPYAPATANIDEYTYAEVEADTGGTSISLANFTSVSCIVIKNTHASNTVRAVWYNARGSATYANLLTFADAATGDTITRDGGATDFTAAAFDVVKGGYVRITGATEAVNNQTVLVQGVAANVMSISPADVFTPSNDTATVVIYSQEKNSQLIPGGGVLVVPDAVPEEGLTLTSSAAAECEIFIAGT